MFKSPAHTCEGGQGRRHLCRMRQEPGTGQLDRQLRAGTQSKWSRNVLGSQRFHSRSLARNDGRKPKLPLPQEPTALPGAAPSGGGWNARQTVNDRSGQHWNWRARLDFHGEMGYQLHFSPSPKRFYGYLFRGGNNTVTIKPIKGKSVPPGQKDKISGLGRNLTFQATKPNRELTSWSIT